jgi:hypothetical protein
MCAGVAIAVRPIKNPSISSDVGIEARRFVMQFSRGLPSAAHCQGVGLGRESASWTFHSEGVVRWVAFAPNGVQVVTISCGFACLWRTDWQKTSSSLSTRRCVEGTFRPGQGMCASDGPRQPL